METLAIFMVSVISTFYGNQVAFSQPVFPPASTFSWGNFATTTIMHNNSLGESIDNFTKKTTEKSFEKKFVNTRITNTVTNTGDDGYGVSVQTKCINGVCNTVQRYLDEGEARANSGKIQRDVELRIAEHKKRMEERMKEVFGNF